jgi:hypothetical protein
MQEQTEQRKPYSTNEIALTMNDVSKIVTQLSIDGFLVNKVVIGNAQQPTIILFNNDKCQDLIKSGKAIYRYIGHKVPIKQGVSNYNGCRIVWSESFI